MTSSAREVGSPLVVAVTFTSRGTRLTVALDDGRTISAPLAWYPRLQNATPKERRAWQPTGGGRGIHWPDLDEDISIENLLRGTRSAESERSLQRWLQGRTPRA